MSCSSMIPVIRAQRCATAALALVLAFAVGACRGGGSVVRNSSSSAGGQVQQSEGEIYFNSTVKPAFQVQSCQGCHPGPGGAPDVMSYGVARGLLLNGSADTNNKLFNNLRQANGEIHSGGTMCATSYNSPCSEVLAWYAIETAGSGNGGGGVNLQASFDYNTQTGRVSGAARDQNNPSRVITVEFYVGGPAGTGTLFGTTAANGANNSFGINAPAAYVDAKPRYLFGYAIHPVDGSRVAMPGNPRAYIAGPDASGKAYFDANLATLLSNGCSGCHGTEMSSYYSARSIMATPPPVLDPSASATNNTLYQKASGNGHGGGNRCAAIPNLCSRLQAWYGEDFGTP